MNARDNFIAPVNAKRATLRRLRATLTRAVAKFLRSQVPDVAKQIHDLMRAHGYAKAKTDDQELLALDEIIARIDFNQWVALVGEIDDTLAAIASDGAYAALDQVGIDVTADKAVANVVNEYALDYGKERSAEMVGMRINAAGELIQNPNAEWQITEGTRDGIRATVEQAMLEGWSNDKIAASLQDSYAFSDSRAMMIARTETQMAANSGALEGYKASGVVQGKEWITAEDDLVSEECQENADAGELALDAPFPSGDDAPPVHPNCRCSIVPVVFETKQADEPASTNEVTE
jgi:SPP1 gp7 family putative phage head morphogenesis protein